MMTGRDIAMSLRAAYLAMHRQANVHFARHGVVALGFVLFSLPAGAADWSGFRGPGAQGISQETDLPTTWDGTKNVVWKIELPGPGASSAIVWGDKVFVTCYTGYGVPQADPGDQADLHRHLVCVDRKSGKMLWDKEVKAKLPE